MSGREFMDGRAWTFTDEELEAALAEYLADEPDATIREASANLVRDFLASPPVRRRRMLMWEDGEVTPAGGSHEG